MRTRYMLFKSDTEPIVIIMVILLVTGTINVFPVPSFTVVGAWYSRLLYLS